jgi:hypothetical protein
MERLRETALGARLKPTKPHQSQERISANQYLLRWDDESALKSPD